MESRRWPIERAIHYHRTLGGEILHVTVSSRLGGYISITSRSYLGYISAVTSNRLGGYISDAGRVHLPRAEILLRAVAAHEEEIFTRRRKREEGRERNEVRHTPDYHAVHVDARALITLYTWTHARSSHCTRGRTRVHHAVHVDARAFIMHAHAMPVWRGMRAHRAMRWYCALRVAGGATRGGGRDCRPFILRGSIPTTRRNAAMAA